MSPLRFFIIVFIVLIFSVIWQKGYAKIIGVDNDLSGQKAPVITVSTDEQTIALSKSIAKIYATDESVIKSTVKERFKTPDGQWCFVTVVIKHEGDSIIKKEEIHCSDTKHGLTQDQEIERLKKLIELEKARKPGYWELFAEFYYSDLNAPLYCRKYAKPKSIFKRPGTVCLDPTGKWKVIN